MKLRVYILLSLRIFESWISRDLLTFAGWYSGDFTLLLRVLKILRRMLQFCWSAAACRFLKEDSLPGSKLSIEGVPRRSTLKFGVICMPLFACHFMTLQLSCNISEYFSVDDNEMWFRFPCRSTFTFNHFVHDRGNSTTMCDNVHHFSLCRSGIKRSGWRFGLLSSVGMWLTWRQNSTFFLMTFRSNGRSVLSDARHVKYSYKGAPHTACIIVDRSAGPRLRSMLVFCPSQGISTLSGRVPQQEIHSPDNIVLDETKSGMKKLWSWLEYEWVFPSLAPWTAMQVCSKSHIFFHQNHESVYRDTCNQWAQHK